MTISTEDHENHIDIENSNLKVCAPLYSLVVEEILPDLGIEPSNYWSLLEEVVSEMSPKNNVLLLKRYQIQAQINTRQQSRSDKPHSPEDYKNFLIKIGYLLPEGPDFKVTTSNVDIEIAKIAGPQLVVPVKNARYALNATNARWGSLYDALYGTDVIPETTDSTRTISYNPNRGSKVIKYGRELLD